MESRSPRQEQKHEDHGDGNQHERPMALAPMIRRFVAIGVYAVNNSMFDLYTLAGLARPLHSCKLEN